MKFHDTLLKYGFIQPFSFSLDISREVFLSRLREIVDEQEEQYFSSPFFFSDVFRERAYLGYLSEDRMILQSQDTASSAPICYCTLSEKNARIHIQGEISGFHKQRINALIVKAVFVVVLFAILGYIGEFSTLILATFALIVSSIYFLHTVRRQIEQTNKNLQRDLFFLTRDTQNDHV